MIEMSESTLLLVTHRNSILDEYLIPEVVVITLILKFRFAPSDDVVEWKHGLTQYPSVPGKGPQLPMKVSLVH